MLKISIITPTYFSHFKFISKYLESFNRYVLDKASVSIYFTIERKEGAAFQKILKPYLNQLDIHILYFEDILGEFGIHSSSNELLKKYGKFSFQTLKKYYTMLYVDAERMLVLDSESMWICETNMSELFYDFFRNSFLAGSILDSQHLGDIKRAVTKNVSYLLNYNIDHWFIETFCWFYEKHILQDMFLELGTPLELVNRVYEHAKTEDDVNAGVFEIILYQAYLYMNREKYGYKWIDVNHECEKYLGSYDFLRYKEAYLKIYEGECGLLEKVSSLVDDRNTKQLARLCCDNRFNIIRCEYDFHPTSAQRYFMETVHPNILASSQNHIYGVNNVPWYRITKEVKWLLNKLLYSLNPNLKRRIYRSLKKLSLLSFLS